MSAVLLGVSTALAGVVVVLAGVAWRRERRLSPTAIGCVLLCVANRLVVLVLVAGRS